MKHLVKKLFVILAIVMSIITVQNVSAEIIVDGVITYWSTRPDMVVVTGAKTVYGRDAVNVNSGGNYEVYGVRFSYLRIRGIPDLIQEDYVRFKVCEEEGDDGTTKLKACEIAVEEDQEDWAWIELGPCLP
jgi:hypothetical protein